MSDAPKNAPRTWNDALDKDDLTTAYLFGYHKRDYKVQEQADRIEALEAKLDKAVEALEAIYEISCEPAETDHKAVRGWIEVRARAALAKTGETG